MNTPENLAALPFAGLRQGMSGLQGSAPPETATTLSELLVTLRKRRWVVLACVLAGVAAGIAFSVTQSKVYQAFGRIEVRQGSESEYKPGGSTALGLDPQRKMQTEASILTGDTLLLNVARDLNLENNATFLRSRSALAPRDLDDAAVRQQTLNTLKQGLTVTIVPKTDIIRIQFVSLSPKLSADVVNKLITDYIQRSYQTRYESTQRVSHWLSSQLDDLRIQVESSQNLLLDLQRRLGVLGFDTSHNQISTSLDDLAKATAEARLHRILAEARFRLLADTDPNQIETTLEAAPGAPQSELTAMRTNAATARARLAELTATLGPNHPEVRSQKAQVEELTREVTTEQHRLLTQARGAFELAQANEAQTANALEEQKAEAFRLRDQMLEYTIRKREFESSRSLYEDLMQRLRTAGVTAGLESMEIDIVDGAVPMAVPATTPHSTIIIVGSLVGLTLGIIVAFLLESLDNGLRSIAEIEALTQLPSLAIVPRARRASTSEMVAMTPLQRSITVLGQPRSQFTEAFRSLRTALLLSTVGREPKYILFTSASPSEGKTTSAANLAVILSQRGKKVLLIDADLRRPNLHYRFGLKGETGLSTVLSGQTRLEDSIDHVLEVPFLDVLTSGPIPPFPTEMLGSELMVQTLRTVGERYDHVVIDSPPILSITDGILLSRMADVVVLVVRHGRSSKQVVRRGRDLLVNLGAPVAGIVINAVDLNAPEYYGYNGYAENLYASPHPAAWQVANASACIAKPEPSTERNLE